MLTFTPPATIPTIYADIVPGISLIFHLPPPQQGGTDDPTLQPRIGRLEGVARDLPKVTQV